MSATAPIARFERAPDGGERPEPRRVGGGRAWHLYLIGTVALIPFVRPIGPGQISIADLFNIVALGVFAVVVLARRPVISLPFLLPVFVISAASLLATTNASSFSRCAITMAQDAYLFVWFVMLANVLAAHGDLRGVRVAWMWVSAAIAFYGIVGLMSHGYHLGQLFGPKGERAVGTFGNANMFADYLVLSFFVIASLGREVTWLVRWPALGVILLALVASKSLGGLLSMIGGLVVWFVVRAFTRRSSRLTVIASLLVMTGVAVLGWWAVKGWGLGEKGLEAASRQSVVGRLDKSTAGRIQIWSQLRDRYEKSPLGIGPGNSSFLQLSIANRERRDSYQSKEAHNDYLGYAVERGPFALLGLLGFIVMAFRLPWSAWSRSAGARWREGLGGAWAAALIAGMTVTTMHSFTIEKLHFRHFWFFVAILCALSARIAQGDAVERPGSIPDHR